MTQEDYVSFETAKLLKEKGFDEATFYDYNERGTRWFEEVLVNHNSQGGVACPTLQMAMKWLREEKHIFIRVIQSHIEYCACEIYYNSASCYQFRISFDSYEEACESAIKYCLENLI